MSGSIGLAFTLLWWACVIGAYFLADDRGRNRLGWTLAAALVPVIAVVVLALLPRATPARTR